MTWLFVPHTRPSPSTTAVLMQWGEIRPCLHELCCRAFPHGRTEARLLAMQGRNQEELGKQHCLYFLVRRLPEPLGQALMFFWGALHGGQVQFFLSTVPVYARASCSHLHPIPLREGSFPWCFWLRRGPPARGCRTSGGLWLQQSCHPRSCPGVPEPGWAPMSATQRSSCVFWVINS